MVGGDRGVGWGMVGWGGGGAMVAVVVGVD